MFINIFIFLIFVFPMCLYSFYQLVEGQINLALVSLISTLIITTVIAFYKENKK